LLREVLEGNPRYKIVLVDEAPKLPGLLDEVHSLIFESNKKIQFILTGSSARKLKQSNVNLLAGRALVRKFHPYSSMELGKLLYEMPKLSTYKVFLTKQELPGPR
jgi:predicted AAA+ superfamily ATPase